MAAVAEYIDDLISGGGRPHAGPSHADQREPAIWAREAECVSLLTVRGRRVAVPTRYVTETLGRERLDTSEGPWRAPLLGSCRFGAAITTVVSGDAILLTPSMLNRVKFSDGVEDCVVRIGQSHWAVTCAAVTELGEVPRSDVKWRRHRENDAVVAGVIAGCRVPLLDMRTVVEILSGSPLLSDTTGHGGFYR